MKIIMDIASDIACNIDEAKDKIMTALALKNDYPQAAMWYKEMAAAHMSFNTNGHEAISKLISTYKDSEQYKNNPEFANGMIAAYNALHNRIATKSAEVQAMINTFK